MDLKTARAANPSDYWQISNSFMKRVRQLSTNDLRLKVFELAGELMDQRNINKVLLDKIKELKELQSKIEAAQAEGTKDV